MGDLRSVVGLPEDRLVGSEKPAARLLCGCFLLFLFCWSPALLAASCPLADEGSTPEWVTNPLATDGGIRAVGSAQVADDEPLSIARAASLAAARQALAESIASSVTTNSILQSSADSDGSAQTFASTAEFQTSVNLRNTGAAQVWSDPETCTLYTLVELSEAEVRLVTLDAEITGAVNTMQDKSLAPDLRQAGFEQAGRLIAVAENEGVDASGIASFSVYQALRPKQVRNARLRDQAAQRLEAIDMLLRSPTGADQRRGYRSLLDQIQSLTFAEETDSEAEPILMFAARAELARDEACLARQHLTKVKAISTFSYWRAQAEALLDQNQLDAQGCSVGLAEALGGRDIEVACVYRDGASVKAWRKMCAEIGQTLRTVRAVPKVKMIPATQFDLAFMEPDSARDTAYSVFILADGEIESAAGQGSDSKYRFSGDISVTMFSDAELAFEDSFSATTGWNPVSKTMVMDVLAINLRKRFEKRLSE